MTVEQYYNDNPLEVWKQVLGPKMHYHYGSYSDDNIFDQTVRNLYPHIDNNSSILDMGCGWGGPATLLTNEKGCNVHGVTNSVQQHELTTFPTTLIDVHDYIPQQQYDTAIFIQSLTHFADASTVLKNIRPYVKRIIISDFLWEGGGYSKDWYMTFRTYKTFHELVSQHYEIKMLKEDKQIDLHNTCKFWYNNIKKLPKDQVVTQIKNLYDLSVATLAGLEYKFITIVAE